jgi:transposase
VNTREDCDTEREAVLQPLVPNFHVSRGLTVSREAEHRSLALARGMRPIFAPIEDAPLAIPLDLDRAALSDVAFLHDFRGYLQADAYAGYDALYAAGRVIEVGCWAHARRYFWDAKPADEARALLALGFIQQLYQVESEGKDLASGARRLLREEQARPVLERFKRWLDEQADVVLPKSPIGEAVYYARAQWPALTRYLEDGDLAIDNNAAERALRRVCTGRKNWLFCGSDEGGRRAAILYSLVATCKAHAIDVWAYLKDVLERIPTHSDRRRAELLPRNWKALRVNAQP